jgi:hypothetical protein
LQRDSWGMGRMLVGPLVIPRGCPGVGTAPQRLRNFQLEIAGPWGIRQVFFGGGGGAEWIRYWRNLLSTFTSGENDDYDDRYFLMIKCQPLFWESYILTQLSATKPNDVITINIFINHQKGWVSYPVKHPSKWQNQDTSSEDLVLEPLWSL